MELVWKQTENLDRYRNESGLLFFSGASDSTDLIALLNDFDWFHYEGVKRVEVLVRVPDGLFDDDFIAAARNDITKVLSAWFDGRSPRINSWISPRLFAVLNG